MENTTPTNYQKIIDEALTTRNDFLAIAAHELRTPLTVLQGFAQMLSVVSANREWSNKERHYLLMVLNKARELGNLANALTDLHQIASGHLRLDRSVVCFPSLVKQMIGEMSAMHSSHVIMYASPCDSLWIEGDAVRMTHAIFHILDNAIKYSPSGGIIFVSVETMNDLLFFTVKDAGIGIPRDSIPFVFDEFYRAPNVGSTMTGISGMGLGLYVAREIIHRHGGAIVAHSEGVNMGTTLSITLPYLENYIESLPKTPVTNS